MSYLPLTILAYILNGISLIIDKSLVDHSLKSPFVYTFYIGLLSLIVLFLIPFGFTIPPSEAIIFSILSGLTFILALLTFFTALKKLSLTVAAPLVGTFNPVFALLIGWFFLNQRLTQAESLAFFFLIAAGFILTFNLWWKKHSLDRRFLFIIASGFFFGLSYVLLKEAFELSSFLDGLIISRVFMGAFVLIFLTFPQVKKQIFLTSSAGQKTHITVLVLVSQIFGAFSGLLLTYAISLASPALVNALYGIQYLILLPIVYFLSFSHPEILDEKITKKNIWQKIIAALLLTAGLYLLAK